MKKKNAKKEENGKNAKKEKKNWGKKERIEENAFRIADEK